MPSIRTLKRRRRLFDTHLLGAIATDPHGHAEIWLPGRKPLRMLVADVPVIRALLERLDPRSSGSDALSSSPSLSTSGSETHA